MSNTQNYWVKKNIFLLIVFFYKLMERNLSHTVDSKGAWLSVPKKIKEKLKPYDYYLDKVFHFVSFCPGERKYYPI